MDKIMSRNREFMKGYSCVDFDDPANDFNSSDQQKGVPPPPLQQEYDPSTARLVDLPGFNGSIVTQPDILTLISQRRSRRRWANKPLSLPQLSYLLWATQGLVKVQRKGEWSLRNVPSAGARHPFETYLVVNRVDSLEPGVYRFLPLDNKLLYLFNRESLRDELFRASYGERFVADAPVCFVWVGVPYRAEWRYASKSHKSMLLDAGHICQNLYLAAESIGGGTCGIGGYHQETIDTMLGLDGEDEFVVYLAPVGILP